MFLLSFFKEQNGLKYYFGICVCVYIPHACGIPQQSEESVESPGVGVTDVGEAPYTGAIN